MPVWKPNPAWLGEAVRSALDQQDCPIELVVVDDGNTEPVASLLREFDDPRLVVVRVAHGGVSRARNAGMARARGDAIRFVDADDVMEPESTARLLELSGPDGAIAYGSTLICDPELRPERLIEETVQGDALLECVLGGFSVFITAMLFPRNVVSAAGEFDPAFDLNEDYEYVLRALEHAPVRGERFVATRYRRHDASVTAGDHAGAMKDMEALDKLFDRRPDLRGTRVERVARAHLHIGAATQLMHAGRYAESARRLASALRMDPRSAGPEVARVAASFLRVAVRHAMAR
jgi:glycosyltransferase involved in cell wall biosynthesis